jgi:hypothetical protein
LASTPYKPITWSNNEPLATDKLNAMASNEQWLFENAPRMMYSNGVIKTDGVKILAGTVVMPGNTETYNTSATVTFPGFFSSGCAPVVTVTANAWPQGRYHLTVSGIGSGINIDNRGFLVRAAADEVNSKGMTIGSSFRIHYVAIGY